MDQQLEMAIATAHASWRRHTQKCVRCKVYISVSQLTPNKYGQLRCRQVSICAWRRKRNFSKRQPNLFDA
jgi:hypothetical protein